MKMIKSIRILDHTPQSKPSTPESDTFSFSKIEESAEEEITFEEVERQRQTIEELEVMMRRMLKKCQNQTRKKAALMKKHSEWESNNQQNERLCGELHELKELMKKVLLDRGDIQPPQFYDSDP